MRSIWNKYKALSPAQRTSGWFIICNYLQRGIALITVPIFTRLLTTEEFGVCNVYFSWFDIFILFTSLKIQWDGLNNGLVRHEEDKDRFASAAAGLVIVMTLGWGILGLLFLREPFLQLTGLSRLLMLAIFCQLLCNPGLYLWLNRSKFDFRYRGPVVMTLISTVLSPLISISAVLFTPYKAEARILGTVVVQCICGLISYGFLFRKGKTFFHREYWSFCLRFCAPLLFYFLSETVLSQSDRLMIAHYVGKAETGFYSVAYTASTLVLLMVSGINGAFTPWLYKNLKRRQEDAINRVITQLCLMVAAATIAMMAMAPILIRIIATREYSDAIGVIPPVSASVFFIFVEVMLANIEMFFDANRWISLISAIAAGSNILLNAYCIPRYGYKAAGWTTLVCYAFLTLMHYGLCRNVLKQKGEQGRFLPVERMLAIGAAVILLALAMLKLYQFVNL